MKSASPKSPVELMETVKSTASKSPVEWPVKSTASKSPVAYVPFVVYVPLLFRFLRI